MTIEPIQPTKESAEKLKKVMKKHYGVNYTDKQAWEASYNLLNFFNILVEVDKRENITGWKDEMIKTKKENKE